MRRFFLRRKRLAQTVPFTLKSCAISCTSAAVNSPKGSSSRARVSCGSAASAALSSSTASTAGQTVCTPSLPSSTRAWCPVAMYWMPSLSAAVSRAANRAIFTVQQLLGASHPVGIYQPLEVVSEVVVHRITQVGRIRAGNERICIMLINNNIANSVEEIYLIAK